MHGRACEPPFVAGIEKSGIVQRGHVTEYIKAYRPKVFEVCANKYGITPFILVGGDRVIIGGGSYIQRGEDGVPRIFLRGPKLFEDFLEIYDEGIVKKVGDIAGKYYSDAKGGIARRAWRAITRKRVKCAQPFFDRSVAEILEACGMKPEDFKRLRDYDACYVTASC